MPSFPASRRSPALLIAVAGRPAEGKTRLLLQLAAHQASLGKSVEGFVAIAAGRKARHVGAAEYHLQFLGNGEELTWAVRDESLKPPYRLEWETFERLLDWAGKIRPDLSLLILDEFGEFEARGDGLMPLWPAVQQARPQIVVLAVRDGVLDQVEARLGREFDVVVRAGDPDALAALEQACADFGEWTRLGLYGAGAGALEMSAGTALHAARIPFGGLTMSSLQAATLTFAGFGLAQPARVVWVSIIAAGLKALAPTSNRVRPMVAIGVQGCLYGSAVQVIGWNFLGVVVGGALVGAWSALQGVLLQYILLGSEITQSYDFMSRWMAETWRVSAPAFPVLVAISGLLHAAVSATLTSLAWLLRAPPRALQEMIAREMIRAPAFEPALRPGWRSIVRDCSRWQFWIPLVLVGIVMAASGRSWSAFACLGVRIVAVSMVLTALVSLLRPAMFANGLRRLGWWGPALAVENAVDHVTAMPQSVNSE